MENFKDQWLHGAHFPAGETEPHLVFLAMGPGKEAPGSQSMRENCLFSSQCFPGGRKRGFAQGSMFGSFQGESGGDWG